MLWTAPIRESATRRRVPPRLPSGSKPTTTGRTTTLLPTSYLDLFPLMTLLYLQSGSWMMWTVNGVTRAVNGSRSNYTTTAHDIRRQAAAITYRTCSITTDRCCYGQYYLDHPQLDSLRGLINDGFNLSVSSASSSFLYNELCFWRQMNVRRWCGHNTTSTTSSAGNTSVEAYGRLWYGYAMATTFQRCAWSPTSNWDHQA